VGCGGRDACATWGSYTWRSAPSESSKEEEGRDRDARTTWGPRGGESKRESERGRERERDLGVVHVEVGAL
jgi:hypothetical protein